MRANRNISSQQRCRRRGVTAVEVALTLPIFVVFLAALLEFNHCFMVSHMLKAAAKSGARYGSTEGGTAAQVQARVQQVIFDTAGVNPAKINFSTLPAIDLTTAESGRLFLVQVTVPYNQVALLPPFWVKGRTVTGQAVMRHE
jgi:Flp pilus assembly protein TadG